MVAILIHPMKFDLVLICEYGGSGLFDWYLVALVCGAANGKCWKCTVLADSDVDYNFPYKRVSMSFVKAFV